MFRPARPSSRVLKFGGTAVSSAHRLHGGRQTTENKFEYQLQQDAEIQHYISAFNSSFLFVYGQFLECYVRVEWEITFTDLLCSYWHRKEAHTFQVYYQQLTSQLRGTTSHDECIPCCYEYETQTCTPSQNEISSLTRSLSVSLRHFLT
jgi:hypothetical protein